MIRIALLSLLLTGCAATRLEGCTHEVNIKTVCEPGGSRTTIFIPAPPTE
jgi:hypothetical protein